MSNSSPVKCYKYGPFGKAITLMRVMASIFLLIFGLFFVVTAFYVQAFREQQFSLFLTAFSLISALLSVLFFIGLSHLTPNIYIDRENIYVYFFFRKTQARLEDIIAIRKVLTPVGRKSFVILFEKGLTPFHRFYGRIFGSSFYPGIYVNSSISDKDDLERLLSRYLY